MPNVKVHWPLVTSIHIRMQIVVEYRLELITGAMSRLRRELNTEIFGEPWEYISPRVIFV